MPTPSRLPLAILIAVAAALPVQAAAPITGRYVTEDGAGIVQVAPCGGALCGRLVQVLKARPGAPKVDVNNRDPALRGRPIMGMTIVSGFVDRGDDWRGTIYDPRNGKTYKSIITRNGDGSLKVQGCIAFFCQTQHWPSANWLSGAAAEHKLLPSKRRQARWTTRAVKRLQHEERLSKTDRSHA